jgi:hypothetical protein
MGSCAKCFYTNTVPPFEATPVEGMDNEDGLRKYSVAISAANSNYSGEHILNHHTRLGA